MSTVIPLRPDAVSSFDSFIATAAAGEALALSRAIAAKNSDGPRLLLLHGPPGAGKTHLLRAIVHAVERCEPSVPALFLTAQEWLEGLMGAFRPGRAGQLPQPWPAGCVATVDDLHVLSGKPMTQRELGRQLGATLQRDSRLACAVGRLGEIPELVEAFRRLPGARLVRMVRPSHGDMRQILDTMARAEGWSLSAQNLDAMAVACRGDVRRAASAVACQRLQASRASLAW